AGLAAAQRAPLPWPSRRAAPARPPLLLLRGLPAPARAGLRRAAARGGPLLRAYALADAGERDEAVRTVRGAAHRASPRSLARSAAFALAIRETGLADELIERLPE